MMIPSPRLAPILLALAACGRTPAAAQPPAAPRPVDDLAHPYIYEVAPEQTVPQEIPPFIEVSGTGQVSVAPDRARASFAVETQAKTAAAASGGNADRMGAVIRALRSSGIAGVTVETFGYTLRPDYAFPTVSGVQTRVIDGYTAINNVSAEVTDVTAVGRLVDLAIQSGANRVSSLTFEASNTEPARREALTEAVAQARMEAETIAAALGRVLGPPLEVRGGAQMPQPMPQSDVVAYRMAAEAVPTPIEVAEQEVHASVSIRFGLGPATGGR
jgi:uncharacterized protein YggE